MRKFWKKSEQELAIEEAILEAVEKYYAAKDAKEATEYAKQIEILYSQKNEKFKKVMIIFKNASIVGGPLALWMLHMTYEEHGNILKGKAWTMFPKINSKDMDEF